MRARGRPWGTKCVRGVPTWSSHVVAPLLHVFGVSVALILLLTCCGSSRARVWRVRIALPRRPAIALPAQCTEQRQVPRLHGEAATISDVIYNPLG